MTAVRTFAWIVTILGIASGPTFFFAVLAVIIAMAYSKQAATQQYAMLALLGAAAERSMPLETAFAAFGNERGGWMRKRTAEIAYLLQQGKTLPAALKAVPGALPPEAVPLVCVGYENGSLGPAVAQAIAARNLYEPVWQSIVPKIGYICLFPIIAGPIAVFLAFIIMPQFQKIFRDFGTKLPDVTIWAFAVFRSEFFWLPFSVIGILFAGLLLYGSLRYAGSIRWDLPGMTWLFRRGILPPSSTRWPWLPNGSDPWARPFPRWHFRIRSGRSPAVCGTVPRRAGRRRRLKMPSCPRLARQNGSGPAAIGPAKRQSCLGRRGNGRQQPPPFYLSHLYFAASDFSNGHRRLWVVGSSDRGRCIPAPDLSHSNPGAEMKRSGFTLWEVVVAIVMLTALTTLCLQFFAAARDQRRQLFAHLTANQEAANLLERAEAVQWNELTTAGRGRFPAFQRSPADLARGAGRDCRRRSFGHAAGPAGNGQRPLAALAGRA